MYGAALYRLRAEDFGEIKHADGVSPAWPDLVRGDGALLHQGRAALRGARRPRVRTRPSRRRARRIRTRPSRTSPASSSWPTISPPPGTSRSTPRAASCSTRGTCRTAAAFAATTATGSPACPRQVRRRGDRRAAGARARQRHAAHQRDGAVASRRTPTAPTVTEVVVERDGETETHSADIVVVSCGAANSARLLLASATDKHPNGLANALRPGRPQLHVPQQPGRARPVEGAQPDRLPEDARPQRLLPRRQGVRPPARQHPDGRQVAGRRCSAARSRGETKFAPDWSLETVADPCGGLLALHRGPAEAGEPRHADRRRAREARATRYSNEGPKKELYEKLKSMLGEIGMHSGHLLPHHAYLKNEIPVAGVAHQAGTCRFGADPADSVLDTNCKAHELDNLYVVDTSFFPSIGAVNPALTAMANAIRGRRPPAGAPRRLGRRSRRTRHDLRSPSSRDRGRRLRRPVRGPRPAPGARPGHPGGPRSTITSSSRCSTRSRPGSSPRARSLRRCAGSFTATGTSRSSSPRSAASTWRAGC